jgi:hypothetical protein
VATNTRPRTFPLSSEIVKKNLLILSVVANVALTALLILRVGGSPSVDSRGGGVEVVTNTVTKRVTGPVKIVNSTNVVRLDWAGLESTDYLEYIENLRSVACPEETIRDIIIADINKLYAERWRESQPPPQSWKYWRPSLKGNGKDPITGQIRLELESERAALIQKLLGVNFRAAMSKYDWNASSRRDDGLVFLAPGKRSWVEEWGKRSKLEVRQLVEQLKTSNEPKETRAAFLRDLEMRQQQDLAKALTPGELTEYQVRHSGLADQLRKTLSRVEISETEFRQLFTLLGSRPDAMLSASRLKGAESPLNDPFLAPRLQELLGMERYAGFQDAVLPRVKGGGREGDPALSEELAAATMILKQIADAEIAKIAADPRLSTEDRAAQIKQIQKERKRMSSEFKKGSRKQNR